MTLGISLAATISCKPFHFQGVELVPQPFLWANGQWTSNGTYAVVQESMARGTAPELAANNVNFCVKHTSATRVRLKFCNKGGTINFGANSTSTGTPSIIAALEDFSKLPQTVGGVAVKVTRGETCAGEMSLEGPLTASEFRGITGKCLFVIGGQELRLDDIVLE